MGAKEVKMGEDREDAARRLPPLDWKRQWVA
jgi:hypothetical protein